MGQRGEIATYTLRDYEFTYFFNIKEDRSQNRFLALILSTKKEKEKEYTREQIMVYGEFLALFIFNFEKILNMYYEDDQKAHELLYDTPTRNYEFKIKMSKVGSAFLQIKESSKINERVSRITIFERNFEIFAGVLNESMLIIKDEEDGYKAPHN